MADSALLDTLAEDAETRVILGYLVGVADGTAFFLALSAAARRKPCVVLKTGRSAEAARAVGSHTGALAGSDRAFDAAVRQAEVICRFAALAVVVPALAELEINPLLAGPAGVYALDVHGRFASGRNV